MALYAGIQLPGEPDLSNIRRLDLLPMKPIREMMQLGMAIDTERLATISEQLGSEMAELRYEICNEIPAEKLDEFIEKSNMDADDDYLPMNVESSKQMRKLLFDVLGVGAGKELKLTKSGDISTGKRQLEARKLDHPVVQLVLNYRERAKLKNTYADRLPEVARWHPGTTLEHPLCWCGLKHIGSTWRVHCTIMTTRTKTGRPACVASWTPILTQRGYLQICDVRVGDYVWTHRLRWRKVLDTYTKGFSPMWRVRFSDGDVLTCTKDHRLLIYKDECNEKNTREYRQGTDGLSERRVTDIAGDRKTIGTQLSRRLMDLSEQDAARRVSSFGQDPLRTIQDSREESDVWQIHGGAPQLDRIGGRWVRISDLLERREASICPSYCDGRGVRAFGTAGEYGRASYRFGYEEQSTGQFSPNDNGRSSSDPQDVPEGRTLATIEEITPAGRFEVFDLSVEEDESYFACGVFSHNSKNPNLQNISVRSKMGRAIRACFVASPGTEIVTVDFSQLELRRLAHRAKVSKMIQVFWNDEDIHTFTAMEAFNITAAQVDALLHRAPAKNVNFAIVYGETARGLYDQLISDTYGKSGIPVPEWLTLEWCENFISRWFGIYHEVPEYMAQQFYRARRYGVVWTEFGRIRRTPEVRSEHKRVIAEGLRQAGNMGIQGDGADMLKLAQAEIQDWIEQEIRTLGVWCWPLNEVHDELIFEVEQGWGELVRAKSEEVMSLVLQDKDTGEDRCRVPIKAEGKVLSRWEK